MTQSRLHSQFGRRPKENGSAGTDHGTAGPVRIAGAAGRLRAGLLGTAPWLDPAAVLVDAFVLIPLFRPV